LDIIATSTLNGKSYIIGATVGFYGAQLFEVNAEVKSIKDGRSERQCGRETQAVPRTKHANIITELR
jgi:hypothetical protein